MLLLHIHVLVIYFTKWNIDVPSIASILLATCFTDNSTLPAICFSQDVWCDKYLKSNLAKRHRWMWHPRLSWEPHTKLQQHPILTLLYPHIHTGTPRNTRVHTHKYTSMCTTARPLTILSPSHQPYITFPAFFSVYSYAAICVCVCVHECMFSMSCTQERERNVFVVQTMQH